MFIYQTASPKFIYRKDSKLDANHMEELTKLCETVKTKSEENHLTSTRVRQWERQNSKSVRKASTCCKGNKTEVGHSTQDGLAPCTHTQPEQSAFQCLVRAHHQNQLTQVQKSRIHRRPPTRAQNGVDMNKEAPSWAWSRPEVSYSSHTTMQIAIFPSCFRCLLKHPFQRFASIVYAHNKHKVLVKQKKGRPPMCKGKSISKLPGPKLSGDPTQSSHSMLATLPDNTRCQHSAIMKGGTQSKSKICIQKYWKEAAHTCKQSCSGKHGKTM